MTIHGRRVGLALLLLLVCVGLVVAQEAEPTKVVGSNSAGSLFQAASGEAGAGFTYELTGTQAGISAFCANQAAAVIATRALTVSDVVNCQNNGVSFYEVLFGVDGYALIASPDVTFAECLSVTDLNALVSPSAAGTVSTWAAGNAAFGDVPFSLVTVAAGTRPYDLLDSAVNGDGLRADATFGSAEEVVAQVAAGTGVLGVVPLGVAASAEGVTVLELRSTSLNVCAAPSAQNVLNLSYTGGERLFAYLNAAQAEALGGAVAAVLSTDGQAALNTAGALSLPDAALAVSQGLIGEGRVGRVFSLEADLFQPVAGVSGEVRVGGSAAGASLLRASMATFTTSNPGATLTETYVGGLAGAREFCNGNLDIVVLTAPLSEEQAANCANLDIVPVTYTLGAQAAVLVSNAGNADLACLTTAQLRQAWTASAEAPTNWSVVGEGFADNEIVLFALSKGDVLLDLLVNSVSDGAAVARDTVNENFDPLFLGAAVNNVPGGLAVMSLAQAQDVLAAGSAVQVVSVDAGDGCVAPSVETIADGSYALSQPLVLVLNQTTLASDVVQSAVWTILSDVNYSAVEGAGLVGLDLDTLVSQRIALEALFVEADALEAERFAAEAAAIATQTAEAVTPEPTVEGTPAATEEAAAEATATPAP